jgi:hypothetical protein
MKPHSREEKRTNARLGRRISEQIHLLERMTEAKQRFV